MTHSEWFENLTGEDTRNTAARKAGMPQNSLGRHIENESIPAESVIKLCRAYHVNPVQGLVDTGYLKPDETGQGVTIIALADATDHEVIAEVLRRIDTGKNLAELWERPLDDGFVAEVVDIAAFEGDYSFDDETT